MADQLAPQRPSDRADRRSGRQQLAEPVLLVARRGQVTLQVSLQHFVTVRVQLGREAAVDPHGGGQLPQGVGEPAAHIRIVEGVVVAGEPGGIGERPGKDPDRDRRVLQGFQALSQCHRAVWQPHAARVELGALLGLRKCLVHPPDLVAEGASLVEPGARRVVNGSVVQPGRHPVEQVGHRAGEVRDRFLGRLYLRRREDEAGDQPRGRADQRLGYPAGRRCLAADRQDEHRADRDLEDGLAQPQRVPHGEPERDREPETPPREPDPSGQPERYQDACHHGGDSAHRAEQRLVDADLQDENRRQRRQHGRRG